MSEYKKQSAKREKRRLKREAEFGPEREIVATDVCNCAHMLECGHAVTVNRTELPHIKRRRCEQCKNVDVTIKKA